MRQVGAAVGVVVVGAVLVGCASGGSTTTPPATPPGAVDVPATLSAVRDVLVQRGIPCESKVVSIDVDGKVVRVLECRTEGSGDSRTYRVGLGDPEAQCAFAAKAKESLGQPTDQLLPDEAASQYNDEITSVLVVGDGWWFADADIEQRPSNPVTASVLIEVFGNAQVTTVGEYCDLKPIAT